MRRIIVPLVALFIGLGALPVRADPWFSRAACEKQVGAKLLLARPAGVIRVATWHLGGTPHPGRKGTDYRWLACTLAWTQADVVAVQGLRAGAPGRVALARLAAALHRRTRSRWGYKLDTCRGRKATSVGLLWNKRRVTASRLQVLGALNPYRRACRRGQRPGVAGYFKARAANGRGVDFYLVSVDLPDNAVLLQRALDGVPSAVEALQRKHNDPDVMLAGAFYARSGWIGRTAARLRPGFRLVPANRVCTQRGDRPALVSQILVSGGFAEVPEHAVSRVVGPCADSCAAGPLHCAKTLSEHCPVVIDLQNRDRDPRREGFGAYVERKHGGHAVKGGLPRKPTAAQIKKVLHSMRHKLRRACHKHGSTALNITILGASGKVLKVGSAKGNRAPACALRVMKTARFPRFRVQAIEILVPILW